MNTYNIEALAKAASAEMQMQEAKMHQVHQAQQYEKQLKMPLHFLVPLSWFDQYEEKWLRISGLLWRHHQ